MSRSAFDPRTHSSYPGNWITAARRTSAFHWVQRVLGGFDTVRRKSPMSWMRAHRDGATAIVARSPATGGYVAYATELSGTVSMLVDDQVLAFAQAAADRAAGCPQP